MDPIFENQLLTTRRQFFGQAGMRLGGVALAMMMGQKAFGAEAGAIAGAAERVHPPLPGFPHYKPRAKNLIYLHMNGAPSQLDLWDYKPGLKEQFNKDLPPSIQGGQRLSTMTSGQTRFP